MSRYIDADLCKMLGATCIAIRLTSTGELFPILSLDAIPTADVRPNVRGEWEQVVSGCAIFMRCNQCKNAISENDFFEICRKVNYGSKLLDFCPNCGADMRKENR